MKGHEKYFKTTVSGLTASAPDYAMIVVGANSGVQRMTREHLGIAIALEVWAFYLKDKKRLISFTFCGKFVSL